MKVFLKINFIIFFFNLFFAFLKDCDKAEPILKENSCRLTYCEQSEFNTNICSINNTIIKTQWLNNIIRISEDYFRYINVVSNKNGDFFIETSPITESSKRIFYGLKTNGRLYFQNGETPFFILNEMSIDLKRHYSELYNIVLSNNKEYLMSISTDGYVEIYDFDNIQRKYTSYSSFADQGTIYPSICNYGFSYEYDSNYYIVFPFYTNTYNYMFYEQNDFLYFQRYHFNSIDVSVSNSYEKSESSYYLHSVQGKIVSCFKSNLYIYCFYLHGDKYYIINLYRPDNLDYLGYFDSICDNIEDLYSFFKGVHLKNEIIAIYYYPPSFKDYGHLSIITPQSSSFNMMYSNPLNFIIDIDMNVKLNSHLYYNDFIKIDENRLCIASVSGSNTQKIYIIIVALFNEYKNARIYYYSIEFYQLYHFNVYMDVKLYLYKNFITYSSCVCNKETCSDSVAFYSTLILFSYPNCSDTSINLIEYLSNNTMNVNDFEINLTEYFKIDNNIFGYIFKYIKIINVFESSRLKLIKKKDNSAISNNEELGENEILKLFCDKTEILKGEYKIEYEGVATEPEQNIYDEYAENVNTAYQEGVTYNEYKQSIYTGKTSYYIIKVVEDLSSDCLDACNLCYNINKTCIYKFEEIITESISITNEITNQITNDITNKITNGITNKITNEQTDMKTIENTNSITNVKTIEEKNNEYITDIKSYTDLIYDNSDSAFNYSDVPLYQNNCTIEDIMNNKCNQKINTNQIKNTYKQIKKDILNDDYNKENIVIKTDNAAFQVSKYDDQNSNNVLSYIDIGKCEEIIKKKFNISESLIILKTDIKNDDSTATYVQYEIYNPYNLEKIELDICNDTKTTIKAPTKLEDEAKLLYDNMQEQGYNLFNSSDSFYNDICTRYTTEYGTDMIISDRKKILAKYNDVPLCQVNCTFVSYNSTTNMTTCICPMKTTNISLEIMDILFGKTDLLNDFYMTFSYSNFRVMKCYNLLFSKDGLITNIGSYILLAFILIFIILIIIYYFVEKKNIKKSIEIIIKEKYLLASRKYKELQDKKNTKNNKKNPKKGKNILKTMTLKISCKKINEKAIINNSFDGNKNKNKKKINNSKKKIKEKDSVKTLNLNNKKEKNIKKTKSFNRFNQSKFNKDEPPKKNKIKRKQIVERNLDTKLNDDKSNYTKQHLKNTSFNIFSFPNSKSKINSNNKNIHNTYNCIYKNSKYKQGKMILNTIKNEKLEKNNNKYNYTHSFRNNHPNSNKLKKIKIDNIFSFLTEFELNLLEYNNALKIDKRRIFQFYWSFLKRGNIIFYAIMPYDDYDLRTIKITLLLISFSLNLTINGFFFNDDSMHKLYVNNGNYNFINQIPQIIFSMLISTSVNSILKLIALTGKDILLIKQQPTIEFVLLKSKSVEKCVTIRVTIFFIISLICFLFYWYYIGCFCAVYVNTQLILIHDTLISFITSIIYPFGYCLLPAILRTMALKAKKKDKKCIYNTSILMS